MLLYNKVLDPYHMLFRMVAICFFSKDTKIEYDRLRIYDFLLAFPLHISYSRLPKSLTKQKNTFKKYINEYNKYDAKNSFNTMKSIQENIILYLEKISILKKIENKNEFIIQKIYISSDFLKLIENAKSLDKNLLQLLTNELNHISLYGKDGLKNRTNLMESKYDSV